MHHVNHTVLVNVEESCSQRTIPQTVEKLRRRTMDATHRPISRSVRTTVWQKGFDYQCHCLYCCLPDSQVWPVCWGYWYLPAANCSSEGQHMSELMPRVLHLSTPP